LTPPTPTPEQIANNISHAKKHGYYLLCGGRYTMELEREWCSFLDIVPEQFAQAWALDGIDVEELATQVNADNQEAYMEAMD
jgi:hypothetical protein